MYWVHFTTFHRRSNYRQYYAMSCCCQAVSAWSLRVTVDLKATSSRPTTPNLTPLSSAASSTHSSVISERLWNWASADLTFTLRGQARPSKLLLSFMLRDVLTRRGITGFIRPRSHWYESKDFMRYINSRLTYFCFNLLTYLLLTRPGVSVNTSLQLHAFQQQSFAIIRVLYECELLWNTNSFVYSSSSFAMKTAKTERFDVNNCTSLLWRT